MFERNIVKKNTRTLLRNTFSLCLIIRHATTAIRQRIPLLPFYLLLPLKGYLLPRHKESDWNEDICSYRKFLQLKFFNWLSLKCSASNQMCLNCWSQKEVKKDCRGVCKTFAVETLIFNVLHKFWIRGRWARLVWVVYMNHKVICRVG